MIPVPTRRSQSDHTALRFGLLMTGVAWLAWAFVTHWSSPGWRGDALLVRLPLAALLVGLGITLPRVPFLARHAHAVFALCVAAMATQNAWFLEESGFDRGLFAFQLLSSFAALVMLPAERPLLLGAVWFVVLPFVPPLLGADVVTPADRVLQSAVLLAAGGLAIMPTLRRRKDQSLLRRAEGEAAAREREADDLRALCRRVLDGLPVPVAVKDSSLCYLYANHAWCDLHGVGPGFYEGRDDAAVMPLALAASQMAEEAAMLARGKGAMTQYVPPQPFLEPSLHLQEKRVTVLGGGGALLIVTAIEITSSVMREMELREAVRESRARQKSLDEQRSASLAASKMAALGEMAAGMAHEINNPLAIIHGRAQQLQAHLVGRGALGTEEATFIGKILETTLRISRIIHGLKSFARDASQDAPLPVPLVRVVHDTLDLCAERFRAHGVELVVEVPPSVEVLCRPVQISQVLLNLLNNAFDAVQHGPVRRIALEARVERGRAHVKVSDTGAGIPRALREKIFQPFFTTKDVGHGTGLGLSIARGIMQDHGGNLRLEDESVPSDEAPPCHGSPVLEESLDPVASSGSVDSVSSAALAEPAVRARAGATANDEHAVHRGAPSRETPIAPSAAAQAHSRGTAFVFDLLTV